jgi:carbon-monoxide dehydrogenase large subunit
MAARQLSLVFGLPESSIRVLAKDVGGSFGQKTQAWREEIAVIAATILTGHTLKWIEDRLESLTAAVQAREQEATVRIGFDADGRLVAGHLDYAYNNGAYPHMPDQNLPVAMFLWAAYKMPRFGFLLQGFHTNTAGLGAYRGPWAMETLTREVMLDVAARECGFDPIELRRKNLVTLADQPTHSGLGLPLEDITPAECLDALLAAFDVAAFRREQARARGEGRYLGLGVACYIEPTGGSAFPTLRSDVAQIRVDPTGKVVATLSTHSQGHGTQTTMAQVIADHLGVPFEDISIFEDDSARGGFGAGAAGSRQAIAGGGAAIRCSALLVAKLKAVAGHILNANPDDVTIADGQVRVAGVEEMTRSLKEIAEIAYGEPDRLPVGMEMGLEASYRYAPPDMTYTSAAHACVVEVDAETGFVEIRRWLCAEDCGTVINPSVVEGQVAGGLAQAIGSVLLEEVGYDARGNPTAVTFKDYQLPTAFDVPEFEFIHANTPSQAEGGFRGVGEGGAIIGPPTLVNAIADALAPFGNPRCLELPLTPSRILAMIEGRDRHRPKPAAIPDPVAVETETALVAEPGIGVGPMTPPPDEATAIEAAPAAAGARGDGLWKMAISSPMGGQEMTARFVADGAVLTGELMSAQGDQAFAGTIEGDRLRWEMKLTKPMKITLKYDLGVDGDRITGKVKMGMFGSGKVTAERA